jgi:hypothetical protein
MMSEIVPIAVEVTTSDNWTYYILHTRVYCAVQTNSLNIIQVNFRL